MSLDFVKELIFTGVEKKTSGQGKDYVLVNYLNDSGSSFSTVAECELPREIKQLEKVKAKLLVVPGRYVQLKTINLEKM